MKKLSRTLVPVSLSLFIAFFLQATGVPDEWSETETYSTGDVVLEESGENYEALQASTGKNPATETDYWKSFSDKEEELEYPGDPPEEEVDVSEVSGLGDPGTPEDGDSVLHGISTRGYVSSTAYMHAGIAINGTQDKTVIFMAKGPLLANYGVSGVLADPKIEIYNSSNTKIYSNDSWASASGSQNLSGYSGITLPSSAKEAGLVVSLSPGNYTAIVKSAGGGSGIALVEAYADPNDTSTSTFLGISTRGPVEGTSYMHAGIAIQGTSAKRVVFMAKGPLLADYGVVGVLANPVLKIYNSSSTKIYSNDSWGSATGSQSLSGISGITQPTSALEAGLVVTLEPGNYTAILSGSGNASGVALVEVYEVSE